MTLNFEDLKIDKEIIKALSMEGITIPTEIQSQAIPPAMQNKDLIARSETGTGKTLAFLLPLLKKINPADDALQAVIIAPTYELVIQTQKQIERIIKNSASKLISQPIIGKVNIKRQLENLKKRPQIIVASAGRLLELIDRKRVKMYTVKTIILDEADRLLDRNNISQTKAIIKATLKDRQILAFSATIPETTVKTAKELMNDPQMIMIEDKSVSTSNISHQFIVSDKRDKINVLRTLAHNIKNFKAIVFLNDSEELELFNEKLQFHKLKADCIHGSWKKLEREKAIRDFRSGKINMLIASDIAARGLDFKDISHIIHIEIPKDPKAYLHRAGRTGRAGKKGISISIVTEYEVKQLNKFAKVFDLKFDEVEKMEIW